MGNVKTQGKRKVSGGIIHGSSFRGLGIASKCDFVLHLHFFVYLLFFQLVLCCYLKGISLAGISQSRGYSHSVSGMSTALWSLLNTYFAPHRKNQRERVCVRVCACVCARVIWRGAYVRSVG